MSTTRTWRTTAKRAYVGVARGSGKVLEATHLVRDEPPLREHRKLHWLHTLTHVYDSSALARLDVPWWTYRAIDVVETWLGARPMPARVFEYGAGASTAWLARRAGEVHSVEHDTEFATSIESWLEPFANVTLHVEPPVGSAAPATPSAKDGHAGLDFTAYVSTIDSVPAGLDLVVIDGRAREACLRRAVPRLAPGGLVVFDNSRRRRYREAIAGSGLTEQMLRGLTPTLPYPEQTSLLYRARR
jgi:hypothetical protein